jgi:hypothetical protein
MRWRYQPHPNPSPLTILGVVMVAKPTIEVAVTREDVLVMPVCLIVVVLMPRLYFDLKHPANGHENRP